MGCGGDGWAPSPQNFFCPQNDVWVHFDAVFNRQKTRIVTIDPLGHRFTVQSRKEAYKNSAKIVQKFTV